MHVTYFFLKYGASTVIYSQLPRCIWFIICSMNYALQSSGSFDLTTKSKLTSSFMLGGFLIKYLILNSALRSLALYGQLEAEKH